MLREGLVDDHRGAFGLEVRSVELAADQDRDVERVQEGVVDPLNRTRLFDSKMPSSGTGTPLRPRRAPTARRRALRRCHGHAQDAGLGLELAAPARPGGCRSGNPTRVARVPAAAPPDRHLGSIAIRAVMYCSAANPGPRMPFRIVPHPISTADRQGRHGKRDLRHDQRGPRRAEPHARAATAQHAEHLLHLAPRSFDGR